MKHANQSASVEPWGSRSTNRVYWASAASLLLLTAVVYWPTLANGFVSDDSVYVKDNASLRSSEGLFDIWFKLGTVEQYYPLVHSSFWLEYHLWGLNPSGYHAVNLLLHAGAALLIWRLLVRLAVPGAWLASAIFVVHPVGVETVAWVAERKNLLSCVFALGSLSAYWQYAAIDSPADESAINARGATRWRWYWLAFGLYVAALFSKTVAVSLPPVLLVILWWKRGRLVNRDWHSLATFFTVGVSLAGLTVYMEKTYVGATGGEWNISFVARCLIAGRAPFFYIGKLCWPVPLAYYYPRWDIDPQVWWQYLFPAAAAAVIVALWLARRKLGRGPLAAALIFTVVLFPALGFFDIYPFRFSFVADHYQYHASIALFALAAAGTVQVAARLGLRSTAARAVIVVAILLPLAILARERTFVFQDNNTLDEDVVSLNPSPETAAPAVCDDQQRAHNNLGIVCRDQRSFEEAIAHFEKAIEFRERLANDGPEATKYQDLVAAGFVDVGMLQGQLRRLPAAEDSFRKAIEIRQQLVREQPTNGEFRQHLAATHEDFAAMRVANGLSADAESSFRIAIEIRQMQVADNPASVDDRSALAGDHERLGLLQQTAGRLADAEANLRQALEIRRAVIRDNPLSPPYPDSIAWILTHLGILKRAAGQPSEAIVLGHQAVEILENLTAADPAQDRYRFNLGWSYANLAISQQRAGQLDAAEATFRQSAAVREKLAQENSANIGFQEDLAATYVDLGLLERDTGKSLDAEGALLKAIEVRRRLTAEASASANAWASLADCYEALAPLQLRNGHPSDAAKSDRTASEIRADLARKQRGPE
jgi:protein O-mannosyl-transferase